MNLTVKFLGAASEVTGSKYLLQLDQFKLLVDCGLFQGRQALQRLNFDEFPVKPGEIDAVILTHAHLDHTGYLPRLFKLGYKGPVFCTAATADLMEIILMDSAMVQGEESRFVKKNGLEQEVESKTLYSVNDVKKIFPNVNTRSFGKRFSVSPNIEARFLNAGHVLGAAILELFIKGENEEKKIVFSGDLGRQSDPILFPPETVQEADILFVESTYGDRVIETTDRLEILTVMNKTFEQNGNLVIPAFSIGRTQTLLMYLRNVLMTKEIPDVKIVVDSPMAIKATELYRKHQDIHKLKGIDLEEEESFQNLRSHLYVAKTVQQSKRVHLTKHNCIILAGSGMMNAGRVVHHLYYRLPHAENTIMISGYQAEGSRGRQLQEGARTIRLFGEEIPVRARIFTINGLSAHADRNELIHWLQGFSRPPQETFIVHGEQKAAGALADTLREKNWKANIPNYLESITLFKNL